MATVLSEAQRKDNFAWQMLQQQWASRAKIRSRITSMHILVATMPKGKGMHDLLYMQSQLTNYAYSGSYPGPLTKNHHQDTQAQKQALLSHGNA